MKFVQIFGLLREHRRAVVAGIALSVASGVAMLSQPLLVNAIITTVQADGGLGPLLWLLVGAVAISAILTSAREYVLRRAGESVVLSSRLRFIGHVLRLPISEYDRRTVGDLTSRAGTDTGELKNVVTQGLVEVLGSLVVLLGSLVAMSLIDMPLFLLALVVAVLALGGVIWISSRSRSLSRRAQDSVGLMTSMLARSLNAIRTVRAANATEIETDRVAKGAKRAWREGVAIARNEALIAPISLITGQVTLLLILGIGGYRVASGAITIGDLVTFMLFLLMMMTPLGSVFTVLSTLNRSLGSLHRLEEIQSVPTEEHLLSTLRAAEASPTRDGVETDSLDVVFDEVCFTYPISDAAPTEAARTVAEEQIGAEAPRGRIDAVTFAARAGTTTAIVGPSGTGKSTLFALLERFYEPTAGEIRVGGIAIRQLDIEHLRSLIGYVEQDAPVLGGTLRENLLLAAPSASEADCFNALEQANLLTLASNGLDTETGENGRALSGGERQRLAIARALISERPILLLDESTSSLDAANEALVTKALKDASVDRTTLVIAHRLATVVHADQIVVMRDGGIEAIGTHPELTNASPFYADLAARQLLTTG